MIFIVGCLLLMLFGIFMYLSLCSTIFFKLRVVFLILFNEIILNY